LLHVTQSKAPSNLCHVCHSSK